MVKRLREKFVIVTMILMLSVFGIIGITSKIYFDYWSNQDILSIIEVISESGLFVRESEINSELLLEGLTEEEPITGIVVDSEGNIISSKTIGVASTEKGIADSTIDKMISATQSKHKIDGYIFSKRQVGNKNTLIVAVSSSINEGSAIRLISKLILLTAAVVLLAILTFYLSRFVTIPAEEALAREKRFISDASHELKTPLGAISVNAQALELRGDDSIYVKNIISETGRMNRLIERLLTLSRLEEGALLEKNDFSLSDIVQEMVLTYESIAFEKGKELSSTVEDGIDFNGNADEIRQLLAILLDNAIKNSSENGDIELKCYKKNNIFIEVKNDGKGISQEDIGHIFERFYTTDQSRNSSSFGLGLAIAKELTERHGGSISAESEPGKETRFIIKF